MLLLFILSFSLAFAQPVAPSAPGCSLFGQDCSCSSDFNGFLQSLSLAPTATCAVGIWTYQGNLDIGNQNWNIVTDIVSIQGNLTGQASSSTSISITPGDLTNSGLIVVSGSIYPNGGQLNLNFLAAPVGDIVLKLVVYSIQPNTFYVDTLPVFPTAFSICRLYASNPQISYAATALTIEVNIKNNPSVDCVTGRGPRGWTIVFMVLLSIHALCLMAFCLVTCKKESLKQKIWDISY